MELITENPCLHLLDEAAAVKALAALAQPQRLRAFRALVEAGPDGLTPGVMAQKLGVAPSVLSFHLKELAYSGLGQKPDLPRQFWAHERAFGLPDRALLPRPAV